MFFLLRILKIEACGKQIGQGIKESAGTVRQVRGKFYVDIKVNKYIKVYMMMYTKQGPLQLSHIKNCLDEGWGLGIQSEGDGYASSLF